MTKRPVTPPFLSPSPPTHAARTSGSFWVTVMGGVCLPKGLRGGRRELECDFDAASVFGGAGRVPCELRGWAVRGTGMGA